MTFSAGMVLLALSAVWGASFLFMRIAAPEFGPLPLILIRAGGAALCLLPVLLEAPHRSLFRKHWRELAVSGALNAALPFSLLAWAMLHLEAGFASMLNACVPFFTALTGALWLGSKLGRNQIIGLLLGFSGVALLAWDRLSFKPGGSGWAVLAALGATVSYGVALNYVKIRLAGVPSLLVTSGSLAWAGLWMSPALLLWPEHGISTKAWFCAAGLAVLCTALAFFAFFRIVAKAGPLAASTVTFLIPGFGLFWGWLFLDEQITWNMAVGMAVALLGTASVTGLIRWPAPQST